MAIGDRLKALREERGLRQNHLAEKCGLTPSLISQIESNKLTPSVNTLGRIAGALGIPVGQLFDQSPNGRIHIGRKKDNPIVTFDGTSERWQILGAGLFQGKIRAVVSTLPSKSMGVSPDKVLIEPGQMKLCYIVKGKIALHYNGERYLLEAGDSAYLDGGAKHTWENLGNQEAVALWVITG
jgi:transcriptional regulator with XRE-family HTH domain